MEVREQVTKSRFGREKSKGGGLSGSLSGGAGVCKDKPVGRLAGWVSEHGHSCAGVAGGVGR